MTEHEVSSLDQRWDKENKKVVVVTAVHNETAASFMTGTYDWRKNEMSVADFEKNANYPDDDPVVAAVYLESLHEEGVSGEDVTLSRIADLVENGDIDEYVFPISRLAEDEESEE